MKEGYMKDFLKLMDLENNSEESIRMMSPLKLAYLGDGVYEVYIRMYLITKYVLAPSEMNKLAREFVKASAQASMLKYIRESLSDEEWMIVRRARNHRNINAPKNASLSDYRYATGLEALVGFLYLLGRKERLNELMKNGMEYINENSEIICKMKIERENCEKKIN